MLARLRRALAGGRVRRAESGSRTTDHGSVGMTAALSALAMMGGDPPARLPSETGMVEGTMMAIAAQLIDEDHTGAKIGEVAEWLKALPC